MKVTLAKTVGYCMGVRRAMEIALSASVGKKGVIYTYGPLIHNPQTLELLENKGVKSIENLHETNSGTIIIRAHGISPEKMKMIQESGLTVIDATCPRVKNVQGIIQRKIIDGYSIVIVGDREHPEVEGLIGFSNNRGVIIQNISDVDQLPDMEKVCIVAQTTQDIEVFREIVDKIRKKFPHIEVYNTICSSTIKRQEEVLKLADNVDCMVVIGGKGSGNTRRLANISQNAGISTYHIETEEELNETEISHYNEIGVVAGTSTPNWMIRNVVEKIEKIEAVGRNTVFAAWSKFLKFLIKSDIYVSIGAGFLCYTAFCMEKLPPHIVYIIISSLYVYSLHMLNKYEDKDSIRYNYPGRIKFYDTYKVLFVTSALFTAAISLVLAFFVGPLTALFLLTFYVMGIIYSIKIIPSKLVGLLKFERLKDIPGSKTLFIAIGWATVTSLFPIVGIRKELSVSAFVAFLFMAVLVFIRTAIFDTWNIQGDQIVGKETIPTVLGEKKTLQLLNILEVSIGTLIIIATIGKWIPHFGYLLIIPVAYLYMCQKLYEKRSIYPSIRAERMVERTFIITGLLSFVGVYMSQAGSG